MFTIYFWLKQIVDEEDKHQLYSEAPSFKAYSADKEKWKFSYLHAGDAGTSCCQVVLMDMWLHFFK